MAVRVTVLLNAKAGNADDEHAVREALAGTSLEATVVPCEAAQLTAAARRAAREGVDAVIAAGGDGTVNAVASGLVGTDTPLSVLPLGTLNHFAKDIGMPIELAAAARAIAGGRRCAIDVGEVNGQMFLNNSSIGLYPEMVMTRDTDVRRRVQHKWVAAFIAAIRTLRRFPLLSVRVHMPDRVLMAETPFVFIGNNEYSTNVWTLGKRECLDRGCLSLYMVRCRGRLHMFWLLMRAILQRLDRVRDFENALVSEVTVSLRHRRLDVAFDGEVRRMSSPLHYRVRRGALQVVVPAAEATKRPAEPSPVEEVALRAARR